MNDADTCVPIGGFINGLRPIALALPLIHAAIAGETYVSAYGGTQEPIGPGFDVSGVIFDGLFFANVVTEDNLPQQVVRSLPAGATDACAFWNYSGIVDGASWEALWFVDGEVSADGSLIDQTWLGGSEGSWWVCFFDEEFGLGDGLYELTLSVEGELITTESLYVGGSHPIVDITINNDSPGDICYVQISPSEAINWGPDELGADDIIVPQGSFTFSIPAATIDLRILNCEEDILAEEYQLDASESGFYTPN